MSIYAIESAYAKDRHSLEECTMVCLSLLLCLIVAVSTKKIVTDTEAKNDRRLLGTRPYDHMARIEKLLVDQEKRLRRLESVNHDLRGDLSTLTAKHVQLEAAMSLMQQENDELKDVVSKHNAETQDCCVTKRPSHGNFMQYGETETSPTQLTSENNNVKSKKTLSSKSASVSLHGYILKWQPSVSQPNMTSSHDISTRSDDIGPLEPVVTQMAQRLTAIEADLLASKADVQTLRNAHSTDIQALKSVDQQHSQAIQQAASSVYTHWGRSTCPSSNSLVYSGTMGGEWYAHPGAATNYLCLTPSPVFGDSKRLDQIARLHGAEFQTYDSHHDQDPVCAVCRSPHPTVVMVPGTNVCWPGWTREYNGYLMAGDSTHVAGSEFICVDSAMESRAGGGANQDGKILVYTVAVCLSLPCPPYAQAKTVVCAVCSQ